MREHDLSGLRMTGTPGSLGPPAKASPGVCRAGTTDRHGGYTMPKPDAPRASQEDRISALERAVDALMKESKSTRDDLREIAGALLQLDQNAAAALKSIESRVKRA